jgi:hypothetical protein
MTSMSTRIDDLPGPIPENIRDDLTQIQNEYTSPTIIDNQSNIKMDIKKKVSFKENEIQDQQESKNIFTFIQSHITEENLLLLVILMLSSRTELDNYMIRLPIIGKTLLDSNIFLTFTKAILILILYILIKSFVLPSI